LGEITKDIRKFNNVNVFFFDDPSLYTHQLSISNTNYYFGMFVDGEFIKRTINIIKYCAVSSQVFDW